MIRTAQTHRPAPVDPKDQQVAASNPTSSVWVNASAGSGKTTILTKRVTRLLLSGVKPERILCLTFTRAAAAEMAIRVNKLLSHWAVCSDNELNASLSNLQGRVPKDHEMIHARRLFAEALACPGGMRIRTLHAFGQEVLRRFPIESGLAPHFAVIEENDARALQEDCLNDLLQAMSAAPDTPLAQSVAYLIDTLGEKGFRETARKALGEKNRLEKAIARFGTTQALIQTLQNELQLTDEDTIENLVTAAFSPPAFHETEIRDAAKLWLQSSSLFKKRADKVMAWLEQPHDRRLVNYRSYTSAFLESGVDYYSKYADKDTLAKFPDLDRVLRREAARLQSLNERLASAEILSITAAMLRFSEAFIHRYTERKKAQAALDYDDLVHETLNLLKRPGIAPWVLHKLDDGLDHLLVDEAQDTSRAQWEIVEVLAEEFFSGHTAHNQNRTLFVVGDEKQSIYSFQNADPEAFTAMRSFFENKVRKAAKKWDEIPLRTSFRSAPAVLRAVDAVFSNAAASDGVSTDPVAHESVKRDTLCGRVEVWPLIPQPESKKDTASWQLPIGYEDERDPEAELAEQIATIIEKWIRDEETLPGSNQPIRPGDIMILLRRRGRFADLMVRALKQRTNGISVTGVDRMHLMEQLPVMDLLALIQFALLPEDDLNLAAILRGPLVNMGEDDLMRFAARRGSQSLWQRLKSAAEFKATYDYLLQWLREADFITPFAMLTRILNRPCPASSVSGRRAIWSRLGLDALDPIEELLSAAQNFSKHHAPSLQHFLHWLSTSDSEIKRELDDGDKLGAGQVRIMTVHASKGLEAPIVFLPDTANVPRIQDVSKFLWEEEKQIPFYLASKPRTGMARSVWDGARTKQMQEYRRLLYVALTRASHRLYIGGWELTRKQPDGDQSWHNLITNGLKTSEPHAQNADGRIVWEDPPIAAPEGKTAPPDRSKIIVLPTWAKENPPEEKISASPLAPSRLGPESPTATPDRSFARGRIIHRLLQSLPDVEESKRGEAAKRFLSHPQHQLNSAQQDEILSEVLKLLNRPDYVPVFGKDSRAEVPLAGTVDGQNFSGQVDRLVVLRDEVWIVDYKTNRPPPPDAASVPNIYRQQMNAYRAIVAAIYPSRKIRCFLLWTYAPAFMEVPEIYN